VELIVLTRSRQIRRALHFGTTTVVLLATAVISVAAGAFWLGNQFHAQLQPQFGADVPRADLYVAVMREELEKESGSVKAALGVAHRDLDALALQLSELQARAIRIDALGVRLAESAGLDIDEFSFGKPPARGGAQPRDGGERNQIPDFVAALEELSRTLESRTQELEVLETSLLSERLARQTFPAGIPLVSGWISSRFGSRNDPITGARSFHYGVDFAGKRGSAVTAVAAGIVAFSGRRKGLGWVVEIGHGSGYATRYAHNLKNKVKVGQRIEKGQLVATLGSSGRSTGNHVHFEVLKNGKRLDPMKFIRAAKLP
jgi:murein DD-endopeptidase MepM/ murein hydrolase activator NlpD